MELLEVVKKATPAQCREIGELIQRLAEVPRDAAWEALCDSVLARFRSPRDNDLAKWLERASERHRAVVDGLREVGLDHTQLIAEELSRRGETRAVMDYLGELLGPQFALESEVEEEWGA